MPPEARTRHHIVPGFSLRSLSVQVVAGPDAPKQVVARGDTLTVGTAEGNDLVLTDETVSRFHLELLRSGDRIFVQDNGSTKR